MKSPNFFIIGAPKCGTSSLAAWLSEHPRVFMSPIKEPFFFSSDLNNQLIKTWADYNYLYKYANDTHLAIGEGSTTYLYSNIAVNNILEHFSDSRFIVMVRNPVEMAFSLHGQLLYSGFEDQPDFLTAWNLCEERRYGFNIPKRCREPKFLDYQSYCKVGEQVTKLFNLVQREKVIIINLDNIKNNPLIEYRRVLTFLGLPDDNRTKFPVVNAAKTWRSPTHKTVVKSISKIIHLLKYRIKIFPQKSIGFMEKVRSTSLIKDMREPLPVPIKREILQYFLDDIHLLESKTNQTYSAWYE